MIFCSPDAVSNRGVYHSKNPRTPCQKSEKILKNLLENPQIHTYQKIRKSDQTKKSPINRK